MKQVTVACVDRDRLIERGTEEENGVRYVADSTAFWALEADLLKGGLARFASPLQLAKERYVALLLVPAGGTVPMRDLRKTEMTAIALLGAKDGASPGAWPQVARLIEWAAMVILQDTVPNDYDLNRLLGMYGRVLLIETTPEQTGEWDALLKQMNRGRDVIRLQPALA